MENPPPPDFTRPEIASELNNLLQIISGTSSLIENIWEGKPGADQYFAMLRQSIARAADVTMDLVQMSGSLNGKIVLHPELARLRQPPALNTASHGTNVGSRGKLLENACY